MKVTSEQAAVFTGLTVVTRVINTCVKVDEMLKARITFISRTEEALFRERVLSP